MDVMVCKVLFLRRKVAMFRMINWHVQVHLIQKPFRSVLSCLSAF